MVIIFRKYVLCMVVSSPLQEIVIMIMDKKWAERGKMCWADSRLVSGLKPSGIFTTISVNSVGVQGGKKYFKLGKTTEIHQYSLDQDLNLKDWNHLKWQIKLLGIWYGKKIWQKWNNKWEHLFPFLLAEKEMLSLTLNANGGFSIIDYKPMCIQVRLIEQNLFYL